MREVVKEPRAEKIKELLQQRQQQRRKVESRPLINREARTTGDRYVFARRRREAGFIRLWHASPTDKTLLMFFQLLSPCIIKYSWDWWTSWVTS